jgi:hypothetical protein
MMENTTLVGQAAYAGAAYMTAYLLYLLVKAAGAGTGHVCPVTPYDAGHLVLKRRYV